MTALQGAFHQQYLAPKGIDGAALKESYLAANRTSFPSDDLATVLKDQPRSREVLISAVAILGRYAALLADCPPEDARDFALFDCGACHHELRSRFPSDARVRRKVVAGRPPAATWTLALARRSVDQAVATPDHEALVVGDPARSMRQWRDEFQESLAALDRALSLRPFGERDPTRAAAGRLRDSCDAIAQGLTVSPLSESDSERLLARLAHPRDDEDRDYHAARQYAWGIREVLKDLAGVPHRNYALAGLKFAAPPARSLSPRVLLALGAKADAQVASNDPRVMQRINGLFGADPWFGPLRLRLPSGQQETVTGHLAESLSAISQYDPEFFRERLKTLQAQYGLEEPE